MNKTPVVSETLSPKQVAQKQAREHGHLLAAFEPMRGQKDLGEVAYCKRGCGMPVIVKGSKPLGSAVSLKCSATAAA